MSLLKGSVKSRPCASVNRATISVQWDFFNADVEPSMLCMHLRRLCSCLSAAHAFLLLKSYASSHAAG